LAHGDLSPARAAELDVQAESDGSYSVSTVVEVPSSGKMDPVFRILETVAVSERHADRVVQLEVSAGRDVCMVSGQLRVEQGQVEGTGFSLNT